MLHHFRDAAGKEKIHRGITKIIDALHRPAWPAGQLRDVAWQYRRCHHPIPVIERLRVPFAIGRVCVVADRGMISAATIAALEQRGLDTSSGTNTRLHPLNVMMRYRDLLVAEQVYRTHKALLETRPIYHQTDAAIRGHVFCSFLALVPRKELEDWIAGYTDNLRAKPDDDARNSKLRRSANTPARRGEEHHAAARHAPTRRPQPPSLRRWCVRQGCATVPIHY